MPPVTNFFCNLEPPTPPTLDDWVLCRIYNKKGTVERRPDISSRKITASMTSDEGTNPVGLLKSVPELSPVVYEDFVYLEASDSVPRLPTDSTCCSEHVLSPEVESASNKMAEWEGAAALDFPFSYIDATSGAVALIEESYQMEPMAELFADVAKAV
ncbi:NAC domain-containing protein 2 [Sesamum alatum]|uniref:NAC domain-containing protein 2 n=1 Tax=Sesamum alatum TaxID=300844 RepID=A0AAE2CTA4_9LAMI|nr:NAC domain-containing protein 2 [Sesamum alatum]